MVAGEGSLPRGITDVIIDDPAFHKLWDERLVLVPRLDPEFAETALRLALDDDRLNMSARSQGRRLWTLRCDIAELPHFTSNRMLTKRQRRRLRGRQL